MYGQINYFQRCRRQPGYGDDTYATVHAEVDLAGKTLCGYELNEMWLCLARHDETPDSVTCKKCRAKLKRMLRKP